jgi:hypothetical protein
LFCLESLISAVRYIFSTWHSSMYLMG